MADRTPNKGGAPEAALLLPGALAESSPTRLSAGKRRIWRSSVARAPAPNMGARGDWSSELWDVVAHPGGWNMCCLSLWCPCIQYGMLVEQLPPGSVTCAGSATGGCALFCALWLLGDLLGTLLLSKCFTLPFTALVHCQTRGYIRRKYGIQSHPLHDFCITWCCVPCALCQEARECVVRGAAEREATCPTWPPGSMGVSRCSSTHSGDAGGPAGAAGGAAAAGPAGGAGGKDAGGEAALTAPLLPASAASANGVPAAVAAEARVPGGHPLAAPAAPPNAAPLASPPSAAAFVSTSGGGAAAVKPLLAVAAPGSPASGAARAVSSHESPARKTPRGE